MNMVDPDGEFFWFAVGAAIAAYDAYSNYQEGGWEAVADGLAKDALITVATGGAGKVATKAYDAYKAANKTSKSTKVISELSDKEFLTEIATRAEKKIGDAGRVAGTKKHTYAKKLTERYQNMSGNRENLKLEQSFKDKKPTFYGDKGSARPDVFDEDAGIVYDYKFVKEPGNGISSAQQSKNLNNVPDVMDQIEINPVKD
ncbi:hypothetical protein LN246_04875 [Sulfurovum mangrovi]|nr:hypothetical protein LN246_04875 [Sulfurovum mangrovi]